MVPTVLSDAKIARLDPYAFLAILGERVIHPAKTAAALMAVQTFQTEKVGRPPTGLVVMKNLARIC